jgi:hypothetical protein
VQREEVAPHHEDGEQADQLGGPPLAAVRQQHGRDDGSTEHDKLGADDDGLRQQRGQPELAARGRRGHLGFRLEMRRGSRQVGLLAGRGCAHQRERPRDDHYPEDYSEPDDHKRKVGESSRSDNQFGT